ncbi:hypothetical protein B0H13DRAFT_1892728 [Mycena leptocephala]|nr:hypothetical protein B0H13DRAFT_1892728 [Mycena leptocephala]
MAKYLLNNFLPLGRINGKTLACEMPLTCQKPTPKREIAGEDMYLPSFSDMKDASSHLHILPSLLLAFVATIPNHTLRYTALGFFFGLFIKPKKLSGARWHSAPEIISALQKKWVDCSSNFQPVSPVFNADQRNNRANKITSLIKCRILDSDGEQFSWNKFRMLSKDIATCAMRVRSIRTVVLLMVEAEHQRKLTADTKEAEFILAARPLHP